MAIITKIKPQRSKKRVNIYLDGKFSFGLDLGNYVKLGLKVGQELSDKEVEEIVEKGEFQKTLDKLIFFAPRRPRSQKEIVYWFKRNKVHESLHNGLLARLIKLDLIDDEKFANWWVGQRQEFRPRSKRQLYSELMVKGINKEIIDEVLLKSDINEAAIATGLLNKRNYKWEKMTKVERKKKMSEYLARKGFNWDTVNKVVKDYEEKDE